MFVLFNAGLRHIETKPFLTDIRQVYKSSNRNKATLTLREKLENFKKQCEDSKSRRSRSGRSRSGRSKLGRLKSGKYSEWEWVSGGV